MKTKLAATTAIILVSSLGSAFAADLATKKAPPAPAPTPIWKGLYAGLNAGGIWGNNNSISTSTYPAGTYANTNAIYWAPGNGSVASNANNLSGFIGGGQIGYNWQPTFSGYNFVAGFEADIQGIAGTGNGQRNRFWISPASEADNSLQNYSNTTGSLNFLGTVRGRVGWLATPTLLVYGTGGLAYGGVNFKNTTTTIETTSAGAAQWLATGSATSNNTQVGYSAGGGVEWMFMPNWSAKAEYLYYNLGDISASGTQFLQPLIATTNPNAQYFRTSSFSGQISGNIARAGVNYHFNLGPTSTPVVAKY